MSAILGPDGTSAHNYLFSRGATGGGSDRPWVPTRLADIDKLIPAHDRKTLVAVSRHMVENWGPTKAIARQIPGFAVGAAWRPSLQSADKTYRVEMEKRIREQFLPIGDIRGGGKTVADIIKDIVLCRIRDGEAFVLLTEYSTGFPAIQLVPSHRIGSRNYGDTVKGGKFDGAKICDGVITNRDGTVIGYHFLADDQKDDLDIPVQSMVHFPFSMYPESRRGYPMIAHGLNDARDSMESHSWERLNMLWRSSIAAVENNQDGVARSTHPNSFFTDAVVTTTDATGAVVANCPQKTAVQLIDGPGRTIHYKAGTGSKLELLKHDNPGEIYESFGDRMINFICMGVPWPMSFVSSKNGKGGGTSERRDMMQARSTVEEMQSAILPGVRRIFGYASKKLTKNAGAPDSPDWWRWTFSYPRRISIDGGRDTKSLLEMHARGAISDGELLEERGYDGDEEDYWTNKFHKAAEKEQLFADAQKQYGVELDPRYKGMWTPNDKGAEETAAATTQEP